MIDIDGSLGEGGGQVLRTSLSLSALTGNALKIKNIRAGRRKPGLMRQHLTGAKAVAEICGGKLKDAEIGSTELLFEPDTIHGGDYRFMVGSAGSTVLVAQTVLPLLLFADAPSRVQIEGGTHATQAPVFEFFDRVYLPCLRRMGVEISSTLIRHGFYPAGGGVMEFSIEPVKEWKRLEILERGSFRKAKIVALGSGLKECILSDELKFCRSELEMKEDFTEDIRMVKSPCSGNVMYAELEYDNITELFSVCGDFDISRKVVGERVGTMVNKYHALGAPVWRFLADQLLLPMSLGVGGKYLTSPPSKHTETNIMIIRKFLDTGIELTNIKNGQYIIEVKK